MVLSEKAGKSTLVAELKKQVRFNFQETRVRKWGKLDEGRWTADSVYAQALDEDARAEGLVIWDRSWASEAVYGQLLGRDRRLAHDPWIGEWLYGRGVSCKVMLGGPHPDLSLLDRTADDLPVHPRVEKEAFEQYAYRWGWTLIGSTDRERLPLATLVDLVGLRLGEELRGAGLRTPSQWCGPLDAPVVFVGEQGSNYDALEGGWLPFSSRYTTMYGRILGDAALRCGWTNAVDDRQHIFDRAKLVIACGSAASTWAGEVMQGRPLGAPRVEKVLHPAALYRWGRYKLDRPAVEGRIREMVAEYLPVGEPAAEVSRAKT